MPQKAASETPKNAWHAHGFCTARRRSPRAPSYTIKLFLICLKRAGSFKKPYKLQDKTFRNEEAIHIVYILCWICRQDELMASIKSLHLFAEAALQNEPPAPYHIHIIAKDIVSAVNLPHLGDTLSGCSS